MRKVACWWWKISVFHWCQLAIHSHDNAHVLDSDSSYTWMIMRWWVWASVCHETSMTEWWEWKRAWSCPVPPHYTPTNLSSLDTNENNRAYSEMDAPFVNPVICETLSTISPFLSHTRLSFSPWWSASLSLDYEEKSLRLSKLCIVVCASQLNCILTAIITILQLRVCAWPTDYIRLSFYMVKNKAMSFHTCCPDNRLHQKVLAITGCLLF